MPTHQTPPPPPDIRDAPESLDDLRNEWLFETEPHQGARPKWIDDGRPPVGLERATDMEIGAAGGTVGRNMEQHGTPVPVLPPEQQILQEEEVRTPPRRETRENGNQRPTELRLPLSGTRVVPQMFTNIRVKDAGQNRRSDNWNRENR